MSSECLVAYCGLYCDLCEQRARIPKSAQTLLKEMREAGYEHFGPHMPGFKEFWAFLQGLVDVPQEKRCRGGGCGAPFCVIRKCALERGVTVCADCEAFPCGRIETLARSEATLIHDNRRLRAIGLEAWVAEQQERLRAGFCYAGVRTGPCEVPRE